MRFGDLDALFCRFWGEADPYIERPKVMPHVVWSEAATMAREAPTIDPETIPVVHQLREENEKLKQAFGDTFACDLMDKLNKAEKELAKVTAERDALKMNPPVEIQANTFELAVELAKVSAERDAAVKDLNTIRDCSTCALQYTDKCLLEDCMDPCCSFGSGDVPYKWRGPQKKG